MSLFGRIKFSLKNRNRSLEEILQDSKKSWNFGDYGEARTIFKSALSKYEKSHDLPSQLEILETWSELELSGDNPYTSLSYINEAIEMVRGLVKPNKFLQLLEKHANFAVILDDINISRRAYINAIEFAHANRFFLEEAELNYKLAEYLGKKNLRDPAYEAYSEAYTLYLKVNNFKKASASLMQLLPLESNPNKYVNIMERSLGHLNEEKNEDVSSEKIYVLDQLIDHYSCVSFNIQSVLKYAEELFKTYIALARYEDASKLLLSVGIIFRNMSDYGNAQVYFAQANEVVEMHNIKSNVIVLENARLKVLMGEFAEGRDLYKKVLDEKKNKLKDSFDDCYLLIEMSALEVQANEPFKAKELLETALNIAEGFGDIIAQYHILTHQGNVDLHFFTPQQASSTFKKALSLFENGSIKFLDDDHKRSMLISKAFLLRQLSLAEKKKNNLDEAKKHLNESKQIFKDYDYPIPN